jgi:mono/diheme cytochrome c family protein
MNPAATIARLRQWSGSEQVAANFAFAAVAFLASAQCAGADDGQALFENACGACHKKDGMGIPGFAPPLANAAWTRSAKPEMRDYLPLVVLNGLSGELVADGKRYGTVMPPQKHRSDSDLANIANYVLWTLNPATRGRTAYSADAVAALRARKIDHQRLLELRAKLVE